MLKVFATALVIAALVLMWTFHERRTRARQLFTEAYGLWQSGDRRAACRKFERSRALVRSVGTQLNVARCLRWQGRLVEARRAFLQAAPMARAEGQLERAEAAMRLAAEIQAELD